MTRLLHFFLLPLIFLSGLQAWQPSGWVYGTGDYQYAQGDSAWYWKPSSWNRWVVSLQTGQWQETPVDGWCFHEWPYFYSSARQQWFFTANPGTDAWVVQLASGQWTRFGQSSVRQGVFFEGNFTGNGASGPFILALSPGDRLYLMAYDENEDEIYTSQGSIRSDGSFTLDLEDGVIASGSISGDKASVSGEATDGDQTFSFSGNALTASTAEIQGFYFDDILSEELYVAVAPDNTFYFFEIDGAYESFGQGTYSGNTFSGTDSWGDSIFGTLEYTGGALTLDYTVGGERRSLSLPRLFGF